MTVILSACIQHNLNPNSVKVCTCHVYRGMTLYYHSHCVPTRDVVTLCVTCSCTTVFGTVPFLHPTSSRSQ